MSFNKTDKREKRCYFRIDDVLSVVANPATINHEQDEYFFKSFTCSRAFPIMDDPGSVEHHAEQQHDEIPESRKIYEMITELRAKLDFVINHFVLEKEGLLSVNKKSVNISASGIRFTIHAPVKEGNLMEIKLILPTFPALAVFAYGEVKRIHALENGHYEVSLEYLNMNESVRNKIIQYTLSYQRQTIKQYKDPPRRA